MSKLKALPILLAGLVASSVAMAATLTKSGEIRSTDATKKEIVLSSGDTFEASKGVDLGKLKVGEKVKVSYQSNNGKMLAVKVVPEK